MYLPLVREGGREGGRGKEGVKEGEREGEKGEGWRGGGMGREEGLFCLP